MRTIYKIAVGVTLIFYACGPNKTDEKKNDPVSKDSTLIKINSPALTAISDKILANPNNAALYNERSKIYLSLKMFKEALNDCNRSLMLDSSKADAYLTRADLFFSQNKTRDSKTVLEAIEKKFPENTEALLKLAELYFFVQNYQKAIDYCNSALKIDVSIAKAYYLKGNVYRESGDTTKAISSLVTAIEQDNKFADAYLEVGLLYASRKNPLALDYYNNVLKYSNQNTDVLYAIAKFYQDVNEFDKAISAYNTAISKTTSNDKVKAQCYYNVGAIMLNGKNDKIKALDYFTKAITTQPNYVEAYFARGYVYSLLNDKSNAKSDYNMCLKLVPNYPDAIDGLNKL